MKKISLIWLLTLAATFSARADFLINVPQTLVQPNGEVIECYASGDEFYNWLHDEEGFTIIKAPDGYYYYATNVDGNLVPSNYKVGTVNPAEQGLTPHLKVSHESYLLKRKTKFPTEDRPSKAPNNRGVLSGITIYIRFSDDEEFTQESIVRIQQNFDGAENSVRCYFQKVSYGLLDVQTTHIPVNNTTTITSFVASNPRNHYRPHNATSNPDGYRNDNERSQREWALLRDAINWARTYHPLPNDINIDTDNDGFADLVNFVVKGNSEGWNDLLWAHKWELPLTHQVIIRGSTRVKEYTFLTEQSTSVRTLCHEVFHVLSAPDLYRYSESHNHIAPAGRWDLMETGSGHMLGHMKIKYGGWIDAASVPTITTAGTYTLLSQGKHSTSNLLRIPGNGNEYFLLEYRQRADDIYESNLPGSGLVVSRIHANMSGSQHYNGTTVLDEVFVLRPGGSVSQNGNVAGANLSDRVGRTMLSRDHAITPFFSNGTYANFIIYDVVDFGDSLQFSFDPVMISSPSALVGRWFDDLNFLTWRPSPTERHVVLIGDTVPISDALVNGLSYAVDQVLPQGAKVLYTGTDSTYSHLSVIHGKTYYYRVFTKENLLYSFGVDAKIETFIDTVEVIETINNFLPEERFSLYSYASPNTGYVSGHNGFGHAIFLELFRNNTPRRVLGLRMGTHFAADASSDAKVLLQVREVGPDGLPGKQLTLEEFPYTAFSEGRWNSQYVEWTTLYFENPPIVKSDFFIGFTIDYRTPRDTFAVYTTVSDNSRHTTAFIFSNHAFMALSSFVNVSASFAYQPMLSSGGLYLTTLPQWISPSTHGEQSMMVEVHTTYPNYTVETPEDWIHFTVDPIWDRIFVDVDPTEEDRIGEIWIIAEGDTARCFVRQGASVSLVERDEELAVSLFPNPSADGIFYLQSDGGEMQLDVFDMMGRNILSRRTASFTERVDLSSQRSGMYILRITKDGRVGAFRLIKQ